jgi:hypothetical protein
VFLRALWAVDSRGAARAQVPWGAGFAGAQNLAMRLRRAEGLLLGINSPCSAGRIGSLQST